MNRPVMRRGRLPAGALMLVVAVSVIIAAILLSLLFLTSNRRLLVQRDAMQQHLLRNLFSGLAYAQAQTAMPYLHRQSLDLFGEGTDSVSLEKKPWGAFDVVVVTASKRHLADTVVALLGSQFAAANQGALFLANENVPLSVNEDAQVRGGAYLPKAESARPANLPLRGQPRTGPAVTGGVHPSPARLPLNCDSALVRLHDYAALQLQAWLPAGTRTSTAFHSQHVSFSGPATVLFQPEALTLRGLSLSGQIVVASSQRLVVEASAQLDNVLLLAPVIVIRAGFRGRLQLIARDTATLEQGCELAYPSTVAVYATATSGGMLVLGENTRVSGVVLAAQPASAAAQPCTIRMATGAAIEGQVFSAGSVENCGMVRGTLMCRRLVHRTPATFYTNYLVNAWLDRTGLPPAFLTSPLLNAGAPSGIAAWLR